MDIFLTTCKDMVIMWVYWTFLFPVYMWHMVWADLTQAKLQSLIPFMLVLTPIAWVVVCPAGVWPFMVWDYARMVYGEPGLWFVLFAVVALIIGYKKGVDQFFSMGRELDKRLGITVYASLYKIWLFVCAYGAATLGIQAYKAMTRK